MAWPSESSAEASNVDVNGVQKNHEQCPLKSFTISEESSATGGESFGDVMEGCDAIGGESFEKKSKHTALT
jgi:hypothetical protein